MKYINKSMMLVAGGMLALASCSDYSDYNTAPEDSNPMATKTLYQNISENENLQDFAAVINQAGCADILNSARVYTLWAPLDGTYDVNTYLAMDSANIVDKFLKHHLADYSYQIVGTVEDRVATMNSKHHDLTTTSFDGVEIKDVNIPSVNGIMHTLNGSAAYRTNLYEYLDEVEDCDSFANYIHQYDIYSIDKNKSVIGPMVNGQQTYKDTVWTKTNTAMKTILHADLENEDSTYTLLIPTDAAWDAAKEKIGASYNYVSGFYYVDLDKVSAEITTFKAKDAATIGKSDDPVEIDAEFLKDTLVKSNILRNLVYSHTNERNEPLLTENVTETDTLLSTSHHYVTSIQNFIDNSVSGKEERSNGYVRRQSTLSYFPWESYEPILGYVQPGRVYGTQGGATGDYVQVLKTKVTDDRWGDEFADGSLDFLKKWLMPEGTSYLAYWGTDATIVANNGRVEMDYYLSGLKSTKYYVYVVFIPETLNDDEGELTDKQVRWHFALSAHDSEGTPTLGFCKNSDGTITFDNTSFSSTDGYVAYTAEENAKIHAVTFEIDLPICYNNTDAAPVLYISNQGTTKPPTLAKNFDRNLRIAGVFCIPESAMDYIKTQKYE